MVKNYRGGDTLPDKYRECELFLGEPITSLRLSSTFISDVAKIWNRAPESFKACKNLLLWKVIPILAQGYGLAFFHIFSFLHCDI